MANSKPNKKHRNFLRILGFKKKNYLKRLFVSSLSLLVAFLIVGLGWFGNRYATAATTYVPIKEFSNTEYPENPSHLGKNYQRYNNRKLKISQLDETHFDFILEPTDEKTATVKIKNIDLALFVPRAPEWTKQDKGLEAIAFTDREWNRQQVSFPADSEHIEVIGGNGYEKRNLYEVGLAKNCLNAGYWEVMLSSIDDHDTKALYYQGWFTFPMGHYKNVFERVNHTSYWPHWRKLEHWQDPAGTVVDTDKLRTVVSEVEAPTKFLEREQIIVSGEQTRKMRTSEAKNMRTWKDFYEQDQKLELATFRAPGVYDLTKPWGNKLWKIGKFEQAKLREIKPVGSDRHLQEIELDFQDTKTGEHNKLFFSGIDFKSLPQLPSQKYNKGLYMPMGIGIPPFYQSYKELEVNHPYKNPYFSVLLDSKNRWIDHHTTAVDGAAMHLDEKNSNLLHLYLLSYERHTLISHFVIDLESDQVQSA